MLTLQEEQVQAAQSHSANKKLVNSSFHRKFKYNGL